MPLIVFVSEPESVPLLEPDLVRELETVPDLELVPDAEGVAVPDAVPEFVGVRLGVEVSDTDAPEEREPVGDGESEGVIDGVPDREGVLDGVAGLLPVDVPERERVPDEDAVCVTLGVAVLDKEEPCDGVPVPVIV